MDTYLTPVFDPISDSEPNSPAASISPASAEDLVLLDAYSRAVIGAVDQVGPAVLHLQITGTKEGSGGAGSGVVFTPDAYVLTNSHVVNGAAKIQATFPDGRSLAANLVGDDPDTDLAVLRLEGDTPIFARVGDSPGVTVISSFCERRSTVIGTAFPTRSSVISRCNSSTSATAMPSTATMMSPLNNPPARAAPSGEVDWTRTPVSRASS